MKSSQTDKTGPALGEHLLGGKSTQTAPEEGRWCGCRELPGEGDLEGLGMVADGERAEPVWGMGREHVGVQPGWKAGAWEKASMMI